MQTPEGLKIYDDGGHGDRYTVIYPDGDYVGMSGAPYWPQGICQHGGPEGIVDGPHLGRRIEFEDLPEDCQKVVLSDLGILKGE